MTEQEMMTLLRKKLDRGMAQYQKKWQQKPASELVELASEIAAVKFVYEELSAGSYSAEYMEYLLRFENPLEVVTDQWVAEQTVDFSEELTHALWTLWDKGESESEYRARSVYIYLCDRAGKGADCWPAVKTIASDLQLSRSTVKRALHDLVKAGLIEKEPRYRENGSYTSNRLILRK